MAMCRGLAVLWVGALVVVSAAADAPCDAVKKLKGTWVVTSASQDGKALVDMKASHITFAEKELRIKDKTGLELSIPFTIDPTKKPKAIDLRLVGGDGWLRINVSMKGIYELDGDHLKLCLGSDDQRRPMEFSDKGATLIVLKRRPGLLQMRRLPLRHRLAEHPQPALPRTAKDLTDIRRPL